MFQSTSHNLSKIKKDLQTSLIAVATPTKPLVMYSPSTLLQTGTRAVVSPIASRATAIMKHALTVFIIGPDRSAPIRVKPYLQVKAAATELVEELVRYSKSNRLGPST